MPNMENCPNCAMPGLEAQGTEEMAVRCYWCGCFSTGPETPGVGMPDEPPVGQVLYGDGLFVRCVRSLSLHRRIKRGAARPRT
ncbi:MAG: hypothetical protein WD333_02080 [Dehalococcoidia bacterium]